MFTVGSGINGVRVIDLRSMTLTPLIPDTIDKENIWKPYE